MNAARLAGGIEHLVAKITAPLLEDLDKP